MKTVRYNNRGTTENLATIVEVINDPNCIKVTLFASPTSASQLNSAQLDECDVNWPLVASVAEYNVHNIAKISIVFDGVFLHAARSPRISEVQRLLDTAETSNKVFFANECAPLTSDMEPSAAIEALLKLAEKSNRQLTTATRAEYFSLLSTVPESSMC